MSNYVIIPIYCIPVLVQYSSVRTRVRTSVLQYPAPIPEYTCTYTCTYTRGSMVYCNTYIHHTLPGIILFCNYCHMEYSMLFTDIYWILLQILQCVRIHVYGIPAMLRTRVPRVYCNMLQHVSMLPVPVLEYRIYGMPAPGHHWGTVLERGSHGRAFAELQY